MSYDFLQLSSVEFERLCCDLIQEKLKLHLQIFKEGKDGGLDLCNEGDNGLLIVQCKRYSNIANLYSTLRKEVSKLRNLKPQKYIVAVSLGLSYKNKQEIKKMFSPFIQSTNDIFAKDDLNTLLRQNPQIEKSHYKLWLSSTTVLENLFHRSQKNRVTLLKEEIEDDRKYLVLNDTYDKALEMLNINNVTIISGVPGIGKSTLARALCYHYIDQDYAPVEIVDITLDGFEYLEQNQKQVFLFEDFLGSNFYQANLSSREQQQLVRFISKISKDPNKKMIMTTREYIMQQAESEYEIIKLAELNLSKCFLDLEEYQLEYRAQLLYNRLYFSDISEDFINALISDENYIEILNHSNFNPRIVQIMTKPSIIQKLSSNDYHHTFLSALDNPKEIWEFAFNKHISSYSKYILYLLLIYEIDVTVDEMKHGLKSLLLIEEENIQFFDRKYREALKELQSTFIKILPYNKTSLLRFENHSIRDYLINELKLNEDMIKLLIKSAVYIEPILYFYKGHEKKIPLVMLKKPSADPTEPIVLEGETIDLLENSLIKNYKHLRTLSNNKISNIQQIGMIYHMYDFKQRVRIHELLGDEIQKIRADDSISTSGYIIAIEDLITMDSVNVIKVLDNVYEGVRDLIDLGCFLKLNACVPNEMNMFLEKFNEAEIDEIKSMIVHSVGEELYDPIYTNFIPMIDALKEIENQLSINTREDRLDMAGTYFLYQINDSNESIDDVLAQFNEFQIEQLLLYGLRNFFYYHEIDSIVAFKFKFLEHFNSFCSKNKNQIHEHLLYMMDFGNTDYKEFKKYALEFYFSEDEIDVIWEDGLKRKQDKGFEKGNELRNKIKDTSLHMEVSDLTSDDIFFDYDRLNKFDKDTRLKIDRMFTSLINKKDEI